MYTIEELEEAMQKVMDEYAGGISANYQFNEKQLDLAEEKIDKLANLQVKLRLADMHELLFAYELKERLTRLSGADRASEGKKRDALAFV